MAGRMGIWLIIIGVLGLFWLAMTGDDVDEETYYDNDDQKF